MLWRLNHSRSRSARDHLSEDSKKSFQLKRERERGRERSLLHLALDLFCPVLSGSRDVVFTGHGCKVAHVAESGVGRRGWPEAVVPFAFGIADGGDVAGSWLRDRGCRCV